VTIASLAGLFGTNRLVDYCASKFAAVGFDEALKNEIKVKQFRPIGALAFFSDSGLIPGKMFPKINTPRKLFYAYFISRSSLTEILIEVIPFIRRLSCE